MTSALAQQHEWVQGLVRALQDQGPVQWQQTHISHLVMTPDRVYKLKKAVDLGFVDFRSLAARRQACFDELRLNKRTAPDLYLDVVALDAQGQLLRGEPASGAQVCDYAVCMCRFESGMGLDEWLSQGRLSPQVLDELVDAVVHLHAHSPAVREAGMGDETAMAAVAKDNIQQTLALARTPDEVALIQRYASWVAQQQGELQSVFASRVRQGCVREVHGDLHLGNVCVFKGRVTLFDCLEFNRSFRCVDVISDLAFLLMDLWARGAQHLVWRALSRYLDATGDHDGVIRLRHDVCERAMVRLKVARLSARDAHADADALRYMAVLRDWMQPAQPVLLITHGVSGSGKSVVSQQALAALGCVRLRSDVERKRLMGAQATDLYSPQATERVQARLHALAEALLSWGYSVIVDATFLSRMQRQAFENLARQQALPFGIVHVHAPVALLCQRLAARQAQGQDPSDAGEAVMRQQLTHVQPLQADELARTLSCDTVRPLDAWADVTMWRQWAASLRVPE